MRTVREECLDHLLILNDVHLQRVLSEFTNRYYNDTHPHQGIDQRSPITYCAQYDDYFERQDLGQQFIYFGIDSTDPAIQAQIKELRDSGKIVHLYGTFFSNVPDYKGSQIQVDRIEVDG